ncbi:MAG: galactose mutarotase [Acidobacteria bacterium]|nr:galactose mutarotase [Acidobacteriota bacterium]
MLDGTLTSRPFGTLPTGEVVDVWTMRGASGLTVEAMTYGGIVMKMLVPDRDGHAADVVLGLSSLDEYVAGHPYFGAITGRVAGRITDAAFTLDGVRYPLARNNPPNHLHGGVVGFDKKIWKATPVAREDGAPSLRLEYRSPDGEEGYPGTVDVAVTYTVTTDNAFVIETFASTDKTTPFSLTHHDYFNLGGEASGTIEDHLLQVHANAYIGTDDRYTLSDHLEPVDGRAEDLRVPKRLGDVIPLLPLRHGALYPVCGPKTSEYGPEIARLFDPASGRLLRCSTTQTHLQVYTASAFDGTIRGKSGTLYPQHAGICLECEGYANGANAPQMGNIILRPGEPQRHVTAYAFSVQQEGEPWAR